MGYFILNQSDHTMWVVQIHDILIVEVNGTYIGIFQ